MRDGCVTYVDVPVASHMAFNYKRRAEVPRHRFSRWSIATIRCHARSDQLPDRVAQRRDGDLRPVRLATGQGFGEVPRLIEGDLRR